ncbi:uncharacterized protein LOC113515592 [Galleria mellonella]|uniref:Pyruvate kinase n=1 Tax=Galleria mellonella TaxID=7137 RepID=A0ABM3MXL5_GALME|nr:uncharacterized protein LOC113515592 [Galleria mellonella]
MTVMHRQNTLFLGHENVILKEKKEKPYRLTPFIITFCEDTLTSIDIQNFIEMGLRIIRFKMTHVTRNDKLKLITMLNNAVKLCCEKYEVSNWPIAISIDIPNACIRTGFLKDEIKEPQIYLSEQSIVELTSEVQYWNQCDEHRVFIDDPYTLKLVKPGTEVSLCFGEIVMFCTEVISPKTVMCKVERGGYLGNVRFVCVRGVIHKRPPLTKKDVELLQFAKEFEADIVTIHSIRYPDTIKKIRNYFNGTRVPLIISTICEQEGLNNIDAIIENSDGVILAREFLAHEIVDKHKMTAIQLIVNAKCRKGGKPLYISGNILEETLQNGLLANTDIADITNIVLQGCGFVLRAYTDASYVLTAMRILDSICKSVESISPKDDFWRMSMEFKTPVNAAEACILSCALLVKQSESQVVILPTVTGRTAIQLAHIAPEAIILTLSSNPIVARKLQLYRGIIPIIYSKKPLKNWQDEMMARIEFAVAYGIKRDILKYGNMYVALRKSTPTSSFCDNVSCWKVVSEETKKHSSLQNMVWPTEFDKKLNEYDAMELPGQQLPAANAYTPLDHVLNLDIKSPPGCQRLTGIFATMGKSTNDVETMEKMIASGMNVAVLNLCYGSREEHVETIKMLRQAAKNYSAKMGRNYPLAIATRLAGRKIRTGRIAESYGETVELKTGEVVRITTDETYRERCSTYTVYVDFIYFADQISKGDYILLDNETIMLKVEMISTSTLTCKIERGGFLGSYKDVFVPNVVFNMPNYSDRDKLDIEMAVRHQIDIIIASFVHSPVAITELRSLLGEKGKKIAIIANIQTIEGFRNFDDILAVTNGIMITRQELGSDITPKKLVIAQKNMIARANICNVPVSVSAHLLSSMRYKKIPLRAELLDIANCILDGVDALVLSAETAVGQYPTETVACLASSCKEAEACVWTKQIFHDLIDKTSLPCDQATGSALAAVLAAQRTIAAAIIVITTTGKSAQIVAKYRPRCPIIAVTRYAPIARQLHMWRGIIPLIYEDSPDTDWSIDLEKRYTFCMKWAMEQGFIRIGDPIILVSGWKQGSGYTNTMRIIYATADIIVL